MSKADVVALAPSQWKARPASGQAVCYFEAPDVPVQVELDANDAVVKLNPWPFI